jgi:hypothetical protein
MNRKPRPLNFSQFVEGRRWGPWVREGLEDADVVAGGEPCIGEAIHRASARFYALQTLMALVPFDVRHARTILLDDTAV